jgi:hypothetical protein
MLFTLPGSSRAWGSDRVIHALIRTPTRVHIGAVGHASIDTSAHVETRERTTILVQLFGAAGQTCRRYITSLRSAYFTPDVTLLPSCNKKCWNSSASPVFGTTLTS